MRAAEPGFISLAEALGSSATAGAPARTTGFAAVPAAAPSSTISAPEDTAASERGGEDRRGPAACADGAAMSPQPPAACASEPEQLAIRSARLFSAALTDAFELLLGDEPVRLRVAPADGAIACPLPVVIDPTLEVGDAILECRAGEIDARLAVRFAALLGHAAR